MAEAAERGVAGVATKGGAREGRRRNRRNRDGCRAIWDERDHAG